MRLGHETGHDHLQKSYPWYWCLYIWYSYRWCMYLWYDAVVTDGRINEQSDSRNKSLERAYVHKIYYIEIFGISLSHFSVPKFWKLFEIYLGWKKWETWISSREVMLFTLRERTSTLNVCIKIYFFKKLKAAKKFTWSRRRKTDISVRSAPL